MTSNAGTTLLELTFAMAILTIVMGALFTMSQSIGDTAKVQDVKIIAVDEGRRALLGLIPPLRQAQALSINYEKLPADVLRFRIPADNDGNGLAINAANVIELGEEIIVRRDVDDENGDGISSSQLIMFQDDSMTVLANHLSPDAGPTLIPGTTQLTKNTAGFWVEKNDGALSITIRTQGKDRKGRILRQEYTQLVKPRN
tara:strand:- start:1972 stop:2571 length:600 start_codon:yes stop_codon:yes gene_type:complete